MKQISRANNPQFRVHIVLDGMKELHTSLTVRLDPVATAKAVVDFGDSVTP